jgi:3D (Asp-Asp-Asp) domain-containing protein
MIQTNRFLIALNLLLTGLLVVILVFKHEIAIKPVLSEPEAFGEVTAYTLRPQETDSTPCETALGPKVDICEWSKREQLCASRAYPLLTKLQVGDIQCIVVDRPAVKYGERVDLIMSTVEDALTFGIKRDVTVIVLR